MYTIQITRQAGRGNHIFLMPEFINYFILFYMKFPDTIRNEQNKYKHNKYKSILQKKKRKSFSCRSANFVGNCKIQINGNHL